jgi:hypothetical protein
MLRLPHNTQGPPVEDKALFASSHSHHSAFYLDLFLGGGLGKVRKSLAALELCILDHACRLVSKRR